MRDRVGVPYVRRKHGAGLFAVRVACVITLIAGYVPMMSQAAYADSAVAAERQPVTSLFGVPDHWNDTPIGLLVPRRW